MNMNRSCEIEFSKRPQIEAIKKVITKIVVHILGSSLEHKYLRKLFFSQKELRLNAAFVVDIMRKPCLGDEQKWGRKESQNIFYGESIFYDVISGSRTRKKGKEKGFARVGEGKLRCGKRQTRWSLGIHLLTNCSFVACSALLLRFFSPQWKS